MTTWPYLCNWECFNFFLLLIKYFSNVVLKQILKKSQCTVTYNLNLAIFFSCWESLPLSPGDWKPYVFILYCVYFHAFSDSVGTWLFVIAHLLHLFFYSIDVWCCNILCFLPPLKSYKLSKFSAQKDAFVIFYSIVAACISALISELWAVGQHCQNCNKSSLHLRGTWKSVIIIDLNDVLVRFLSLGLAGFLHELENLFCALFFQDLIPVVFLWVLPVIHEPAVMCISQHVSPLNEVPALDNDLAIWHFTYITVTVKGSEGSEIFTIKYFYSSAFSESQKHLTAHQFSRSILLK